MKISVFLACIISCIFSILIAQNVCAQPSRQYQDDRVADVVETASRAIVNIKTEELLKTESDEKKPSSVFRKYFSAEDEIEELVENIGSGVVLDSRGIIVTNEHLIARAINIRVKFINGKEYEAYVLGSDPEYDIALLKIVSDKTDFPHLAITERKIRVGERAIVIGNPYGLSSSVSLGVVSALGRNLKIDNKIYANLIQTDAAINPGNSGGVLLDINGSPMGIVTAIYGEGKGIGFAIPMDDVMTILSEFIESKISRPILGLFIEKQKEEKKNYLLVNRVIPGSPAEKYGFNIGDRIIEVNKKPIRESIKIQSAIRSVKSSDAFQLRIVRNGKKYFVNIMVDEIQDYTPQPVDRVLCGMRVSDISGYPKLKYRLRDKNGVVVLKVIAGGIASKAGLKKGDVIVKINNNPVQNNKDFDTYMIEGLKRNYILYQVKRDDSLFFLPVKLDTLL
ncbi:MAG: trypsin-like peptidase domain-containing protein [Syntrophorhabdaceae bacterium]